MSDTRKAVVKTEQITSAFNTLVESLESIGVPMNGARLINAVGSGYEILGAPSGVPSILGNKESALHTLQTFSGAVTVVSTYFQAQAVTEPQATESSNPTARKRAASN